MFHNAPGRATSLKQGGPLVLKTLALPAGQCGVNLVEWSGVVRDRHWCPLGTLLALCVPPVRGA